MVIALVLSGGTGSRLGADIPKQYLRVQGRPVLLYCMETLHKSPVIDAVQIVAVGWKCMAWQENSEDFPFRGRIGNCLFSMD